MLYFDKEYLSQYLDTGLSLKVFVDGNMLSVPSKNDLGKIIFLLSIIKILFGL